MLYGNETSFLSTNEGGCGAFEGRDAQPQRIETDPERLDPISCSRNPVYKKVFV